MLTLILDFIDTIYITKIDGYIHVEVFCILDGVLMINGLKKIQFKAAGIYYYTL